MNINFKRGMALLVDIVICLIIVAIVIYMLKLDITKSIGIINIINLCFIIIYFTIQESIYSLTIGKKIFKLKIINKDGKKINFKQALIRNLLRMIDHLLVGYILVLINDDNKRVGDIVANTRVVSEYEIYGRLMS